MIQENVVLVVFLGPPALPFPVMIPYICRLIMNPGLASPSNPNALQQSSKQSSNGVSPGLVPGDEANCIQYSVLVYKICVEGLTDLLNQFKDPINGILDQQEFPALHLHYVSPGDIMCFTTTRTELSVNVAPHFLQQARYATETSEV